MLEEAEGKPGKVTEDICVLLRVPLGEDGREEGERGIYSMKFKALGTAEHPAGPFLALQKGC